MKLRFTTPFLLVTLFTLTLGVGCGSGSNSPTMSEAGATNSNSTPTNTPAQAGTVVNRIEKSGTIDYKIYLQPEANATNRKGIVLLGSGNNQDNPGTGSLDEGLENNTANELAKLGYVAAIVAYRSGLPIDFVNDKQASDKWNTNSENLGTDMSNVADTIIATYGGGLSRSRVITGGTSYTSFMLLTNIAFPNTSLSNTKGVLAACGSTGKFDAENFKLPIFSLNCHDSIEDGDNVTSFYGQPLIDKITKGNKSPEVIADSSFFTDPACNTHCGGDTNTWTANLVGQVKVWLP